MRLSEIPARLQVTVVRDAEFRNLGFLFDELPDKLLFVEDQRFVSAARAVRGRRAILCTPELAGSFTDIEGLATALEPRLAFFQLQQFLVDETEFYWLSVPSDIHPSARIHPRAWIAPNNVSIGAGCVVDANAVIDERTMLGEGVHVRAGAILGAEGFQPARYPGGVLQMAHGGGLTVHDGVQIFANAVVAGAVFRQMTTLGEQARIGNGAFVSHNVQVGRRCFIGHNCTINGNSTIGDDAWIGPNATISNLLHIGERAQVSLGAVVIRSVPPDTRVTGTTALEHRRMLRHMVSISQGEGNSR
jgi:UDP-3-O-[3-hydroxymyristoyl] glucosamine N-acyltransferase